MKEIKSGGFGRAICDWVTKVRMVDFMPEDQVPPGFKMLTEIVAETGLSLQKAADRLRCGVKAGVIETIELRRITGRQRRLVRHYRLKEENQKAESRKRK